jgi:phage terminase small subunit
MAGQPNRSGGARPGAGRPRKPPVLLDLGTPTGVQLTPLEFLLALMRCPTADARTRLDAAKALMPYCHARKVAGGKKDQQQEAANGASVGKFSPGTPPKLVVINA